MENKSLWILHDKKPRSYPKLNENIESEVVIVGGGITGVTAALSLAQAGKKVVLIDAHRIGGTTTSASTGNLYIPVQPYYRSIVQKFDLKTATQVAQSRSWAIDTIEKNIANFQINCQFARRPWYAYALEKKDFLEKELEILQRMNLDAQYTPHIPFQLHFKKAIVLNQQARFNPLQYVQGLVDQLLQLGVSIYEKSPILSLKEDKVPKIYTELGSIRAKFIILATHTPINFNRIQTYTAPYRSYVIASTSKKDLPDAHCWNVDKTGGIHSMSTHGVTSNQVEFLVLAGQHHKTGQEEDCKIHFSKLSEFLYKYFPEAQFAHHWSAQHYHAADDLPYIGKSNIHPNTYMATGYFADGLVYGTLAGSLIASKILGEKSTYQSIYNPSRSKLFASLPFLFKENANVLFQYLKDLPILKTKRTILPGEACILEINQQKYAAYRDLEHKMHVVSAICTHMKCVVNWNNAEKSWDCPCHGSRFTPSGKVIEGPATKDLEQFHGIIS